MVQVKAFNSKVARNYQTIFWQNVCYDFYSFYIYSSSEGENTFESNTHAMFLQIMLQYLRPWQFQLK